MLWKFAVEIIITMTSKWARWRLKSPASRLFIQPYNQAHIKKHQSSASLAFVRGIHRWPGNGSFWWRHNDINLFRIDLPRKWTDEEVVNQRSQPSGGRSVTKPEKPLQNISLNVVQWSYMELIRYLYHFTPWVAIQASRCAGRVDRTLAVKNPGDSLRPSYGNGGRAVPPGTIAVLLQDIPGEEGSLPITYPDLIRPMYWASLVGI